MHCTSRWSRQLSSHSRLFSSSCTSSSSNLYHRIARPPGPPYISVAATGGVDESQPMLLYVPYRTFSLTYFLYRPLFFSHGLMTFSTSWLADAIAADAIVADSNPFGSGVPLMGLKNHRILIPSSPHSCFVAATTPGTFTPHGQHVFVFSIKNYRTKFHCTAIFVVK